MSTQPYEYTQQQPPAATAGGRGLVIAGIVSAVAGVVLGIVSFVLLISGVVGAVGDQLSAPELDGRDSVVTLDAGSYLVFQSDDTPPLGVADVAVLGPTGLSVPVTGPGLDEDFSRNGRRFVAIASFQAPSPGEYILTVAGPDSGGVYVIAPGLTSSVAGRGWWALGIAAGALLVLLGLILLVVGLTRRRKARPQPAYQPTYQPTGQPGYQPGYQPVAYPPAAGPPAGWYPDPDPSRPGGQRYWDGATWTGHIG